MLKRTCQLIYIEKKETLINENKKVYFEYINIDNKVSLVMCCDCQKTRTIQYAPMPG
jgi:hypothetical protein